MILGLQVASAQDNDREPMGWFMWCSLIQDKLPSDTMQSKCSFITFAIFHGNFPFFKGNNRISIMPKFHLDLQIKFIKLKKNQCNLLYLKGTDDKKL